MARVTGSKSALLFPGQGSQRKGMGAGLFERFPEHVAMADRILGYSIAELCLEDRERRLALTQYAQPAIYFVNALAGMALEQEGFAADFVAGHSLGEYNALFASSVYDFQTGLRIVKKRGELMGTVNGGGMLAVIGLDRVSVGRALEQLEIADVDVANHNSARQLVLSGERDSLDRFGHHAMTLEGVRCVPLNVSAAFHSRYMRKIADEFAGFIQAIRFNPPKCPIISNVTGRVLQHAEIQALLSRQIYSPVRWFDSMNYLLQAGVGRIREAGTGQVLTGLWREIEAEYTPPTSVPQSPAGLALNAQTLGCSDFRRRYGLRFAYIAGAMFRGIGSTAMVSKMAQAGMLGFFGAGGLSAERIEQAILRLKVALPADAKWGMNLLHAPEDVGREQAAVDLYLKHDVRYVEAAGYLRMTAPLIEFRFKHMEQDDQGRAQPLRHVVAKVSRPEIARQFLQPAPAALVDKLLQEGRLSPAEAELARSHPVCDALCLEADSGGHTDGGNLNVLLPQMMILRDQVMSEHGYPYRIAVGAAGGIGTPHAAMSAFVMGADFIVTGSINQCSPQADTSDSVKDMLSEVEVQDTAYAPAGDMFELGARVQVLKKGTLFSARGNKLHQLYKQCNSLDEIDGKTRASIEKFYFNRSFEQVWEETHSYFASLGKHDEIEKATRDPKHKMALVFRWYFAHSIRLAVNGETADRANYQVHCGPALGAFNSVVRGTPLQDWRKRHVDSIALWLMAETASLINQRLSAFSHV
ncbi:ACP S-malonyltransferase [Pseudomonas sp. H3(2019)]|nr:ACP S-malonyltransferase [Pseudomonas sp. H3(2019)]